MRSYQTLKIHLPGEEALFSMMYGYYDELFRYGVRFTADVEETKDALNQFFIHLWENRDKMERIENFKAYIFVSYKRWLITHLQNLQKRRTHFSGTPDTTEPSELSYEETLIIQVQDKEIKNLLKGALASLPPRQRQLLQMRFYDGKSFEEIAEQTSLSIRTVYNKLHEGLKKLRSNKLITHLKSKLYQ